MELQLVLLVIVVLCTLQQRMMQSVKIGLEPVRGTELSASQLIFALITQPQALMIQLKGTFVEL